MVLITADNLTLGYAGKTVASRLTFSVSEGDFLCVVGHNGAGKTTLLRTLLGLHPLSGGTLTTGNLTIGYLPQQTSMQKDFPASVEEIVRSGFQGRKGRLPFYTREEKRIARECLREMGMDKSARACYRELSGGQQQRVLLARALCSTRRLPGTEDGKAPLLVLDEPTAALDPEASAELCALLSSLNKEKKETVIMITHDIRSALSMATHVLHVADTPFFGTAEEYARSGLYSVFSEEAGE